MSKFTNDYQNFFLKSQAGQDFVKWVDEQLDNAHRAAEKDPLNAMSPAAQAKVFRDVKDHINSICLERKPIGAK